MSNEIVIRDMRRKEKFVIDDEYLNGYAKLCGIYSTGVYNSLCRHADFHTQECFPSIERMADQLSISSASVKRGIQALIDWNIILKERTRHPTNAKWVNNSYVLLDKSMWKEKPQLPQTHGLFGDHSSHSTEPQLSQHKSHSSVAASKVTHIEGYTLEGGEHSSQVSEIINIFKGVNPSYSKFFGNKTQRSACERLLKEHGLEKLQGIISVLPQTNRMEYVPVITTPLQLEDKLGQLTAALQKVKNKPQAIL